ncbi:RE1-silencing transcription factor-like [Anoplophora glabripennis]|uniref:RE1-silencing transcription factor-like n=1 Tax=Anoplophora glabripennis TaxID=217634 RepID=UPI0008756E6D|nr:RE1-silencing transcription factor-like [Anoplophora glabripennis]
MNPAVHKTCVDVDEQIKSFHTKQDIGIESDASLYLPIKIESDDFEDTWVKPEYVMIKTEINYQESSVAEEVKASYTNEYNTELDELELQNDPTEPKIYTLLQSDPTSPLRMQDGPETKDPLKVVNYKCMTCPYETNWKCNLVRHSRRHTDASLLKLFPCDKCDFKSKYQESVASHKVVHKSLVEVRMYRCDLCDFETRHRGNLPKHQLLHKDLSEVKTYKCGKCEYVTVYKAKLARHQVRHRNKPKVQRFSCDKCDFESKREKTLIVHLIKHRSAGDVQT